MTPRQLPLPLPARTALGRDDFFVTEGSAMAVAQIDAWRHWPQGRCVLTGPEGAGKTHLARVWAHDAGARVRPAAGLRDADVPALCAAPLCLEDAETLAGQAPDEEALFHLMNLAAAERVPLLLTARETPARWGITLPDLRSRLEAAQIVRLGPPDDAALTALLVKLFADRQIVPAPEVVPYLVARMQRSHAAAQDIVARLDAAALARKARVTRPLAAAVLNEC